jgi:hypothetical protein
MPRHLHSLSGLLVVALTLAATVMLQTCARSSDSAEATERWSSPGAGVERDACLRKHAEAACRGAGPHNVRNASGKGTELAKKAVFAMDFSPDSGAFPYRAVEAMSAEDGYYRTIQAMRAAGIDALAHDSFDTARDWDHAAALAKAVRRWNDDHDDTFCWALMPEPMDVDTMIDVFKKYADGRDYCWKDGKPVFLSYGSNQIADGAWVDDFLRPLKIAGLEPFYGWNGSPYSRAQVANLFRRIRNVGIKAAYVSFSVGPYDSTAEKIMNMKSAIAPADILPGASVAYWIGCGRKQTHNYQEHHGIAGGLKKYLEAMLPGGLYGYPDMFMLTIWNDFTEDTMFIPAEHACGGPYTLEQCLGPSRYDPQLPVWSHRGAYEFIKRYIEWYKTGQEPDITKDKIFYMYRQHPKEMAAPPTDRCNTVDGYPMSGTEDAADVIYITTELTAPADLTVTLGGAQIGAWRLPAGSASVEVPWGAQRGRPTFTLTRSGRTVLEEAGKLEITNAPRALDGALTRNFNHYIDFAAAP